MNNFKKYILPTIEYVENEDPCIEEQLEGLKLYQEFIGNYLNYNSPYKELLVYHGVGSGKTHTAINVYNILYNFSHNWNVFLLIPGSLHNESWMKDIKKYMNKNDFEKQFSNIIFIHYELPDADTIFTEKLQTINIGNKNIFIIDEVHRFITNVYNNIHSNKGKRGQIIYDYIQQEKRENTDTRILLLSATPIINVPFEFALIFNLLRPDIFPTSEAQFDDLFISTQNYTSLKSNTKNLFQRRILGLVSYYIGATPNKYAQKNVKHVNVPMESLQNIIYENYEKKEELIERTIKSKSRSKVSNTLSSLTYTRKTCNFVFDDKRPKPTEYKIKDEDILLFDDKKKELIKSNPQILQYEEAINNYKNKIKQHLDNIHKEDIANNYTIENDISECTNNVITAYMKSSHQKSKLLLELYKFSPKYIRIIFNIRKTIGTVLMYSNFISMEGLELFKLYLHIFGYISIDNDKELNKNSLEPNNNLSKDNYRYCEYHNGIEKEDRRINKYIFNLKDNRYGKYCKIIMVSPTGSESVNLYNIRQIHILEPYWNEARIEQLIGCALQCCHHKDLPLNERIVDIFRYKMVRKNNKSTTDEFIESTARKKSLLLMSFINVVKEAAIDCELFKAHNMMASKYKCFNFTQETLFDSHILPAYKLDLDYDTKLNNGLNALNSKVVRIRVRNIQAVIRNDDGSYTEKKTYWYHDNRNVVYDYELNFPIGKLLKDENEEFIFHDTNIYIIHNIIKVPINN